MQARMDNPAMVVPGAMTALVALSSSVAATGLPNPLLLLITLRASQINGCSVCVELHSRELRTAGESDERIVAVAAWRDTPWYSDAERAALALAEAVTRLSDRPEAVSDAIWAEASRHFDDKELAGLIVAIAAVNVWNRLNAATRQVAGARWD
ncbi:MAG: carboxymuconolactone decarboxylase family protein [Pseudonocardia sp.]|nr:carboxymuconolactone decarboxylase family protein [Pseudonocardia sp.]